GAVRSEVWRQAEFDHGGNEALELLRLAGHNPTTKQGEDAPDDSFLDALGDRGSAGPALFPAGLKQRDEPVGGSLTGRGQRLADHGRLDEVEAGQIWTRSEKADQGREGGRNLLCPLLGAFSRILHQ